MTRILGPLASTACVLILLPQFVFNKKTIELKYLYQYRSPLMHTAEYVLEFGQYGFIRNNCPFKNCYVTSNESQLIDVVVFDVRHLKEMSPWDRRRRVTQKFVFMSGESAHYYPFCDSRWDGYFNWTWTYRLDSDLAFPFVAVRDKAGRVVAPAVDVTWLPHHTFLPVPAWLRGKLRRKRVAAAWVVSNCRTPSGREMFVRELELELARFGLTVEIWGYCGRGYVKDVNRFARLIKRRYFFYLAFENSFADDYVTEKLLHGTLNYAVPVVFGGANYSRFLPPHSYINAVLLGAAGTARLMRDLIADPSQYAEYHRWRSHYSYHSPSESWDTDPHCRLCEMLHSHQYRLTNVHHDIGVWWHGQCWEDNLPNTC